MIRGARTKFADEGLAITFTFFSNYKTTTCQFNIIARNEKAIFREISVRGVLIQVRYSRLSFFLADHGHHTITSRKGTLVGECELVNFMVGYISKAM